MEQRWTWAVFHDTRRLPAAALAVISAFAIAGFVCMTIGLNGWLHEYPRGPYTACLVLALLWDAILVILFAAVLGWQRWRRSGHGGGELLAFLKPYETEGLRAAKLLCVIGVLEALAGLAAAYAARHYAPEVSQATLNAAVVPLTAVFTAVFFPRKGHRWARLAKMGRSVAFWLTVAFVLAGLLLLSLAGASVSTLPLDEQHQEAWAIPLFALGSCVNAAHFVLQSLFMRRYTERPSSPFTEASLASSSVAAMESSSSDAFGSVGADEAALIEKRPSRGGNDLVVKLFMLSVDTFFQLAVTVALCWLDVIPGFGFSDSLASVWEAVGDGLGNAVSPSARGPFATYLVGFAVSHLACTYLNHYSATYVAVVTMLAAPVTDCVLQLHPSWNYSGSLPPVWAIVTATGLLLAATGIFATWESRRHSHEQR